MNDEGSDHHSRVALCRAAACIPQGGFGPFSTIVASSILARKPAPGWWSIESGSVRLSVSGFSRGRVPRACHVEGCLLSEEIRAKYCGAHASLDDVQYDQLDEMTGIEKAVIVCCNILAASYALFSTYRIYQDEQGGLWIMLRNAESSLFPIGAH